MIYISDERCKSYAKIIKNNSSSEAIFAKFNDILNEEIKNQIESSHFHGEEECNFPDLVDSRQSYQRHLVTFDSVDNTMKSCLITLPLYFCTSLGHTHSWIPALIIPYQVYSLQAIFVIFYMLYINHQPITGTCEKYHLSLNLLYSWKHKYYDCFMEFYQRIVVEDTKAKLIEASTKPDEFKIYISENLLTEIIEKFVKVSQTIVALRGQSHVVVPDITS